MKALGLLVLVCLARAWAQSGPTPLPNLPDETVVATFDDGAHMTLGEFKKLYAVLPPENQHQAMQNRTTFMNQWALMRKLAHQAEAEKLDQLSPSKEALEYYRLVILSQAKMSEELTHTAVLPSQVSEYYEANQNRYKQVSVKAIYIGFDGKKLTEDAAKGKAARIVAQARSGADFVKLVKENSDDETSRSKDGDFATLHFADNIPDAVRDAIFQLKEGEVTEPVRQSNGYYVFLARHVSVRPLAEVRDEIFTELKQKYYGEWLNQSRRDSIVTINNPAFVGLFPVDTTPRK
jgi:peptidyl-prolyl cis-trans isomerase C